MDNVFYKTSLMILFFFIVEIFISGYAVIYLSLDSLDALINHFEFSYEHYIEIAFFHLFSIGMILFIVLHLLSVLKVKKTLTFDTVVVTFLLFTSHIFWYLLSSATLKLFASISLFFYLSYLVVSLSKRLIEPV